MDLVLARPSFPEVQEKLVEEHLLTGYYFWLTYVSTTARPLVLKVIGLHLKGMFQGKA